jgi:hypothetical protein
VQFAARNRIASQPASLVGSDDVQIGRLDNPLNRNVPLEQSDPTKFNALAVTIDAQAPLFFGSIFGRSGFNSQATATVAFCDQIAGFRLPTNSDATVPLLPFTLQLTEWRNLLENGGDDNFTYDPESDLVIPGQDGIPEVKLFPVSQGAGNWGTVDIGSRINSTADLHRQIQYGVNADDLAVHGGSLELNRASGTLTLNGEPGISAGIKSALETIIGQPRAIPLFRTLGGQGETLNYEIVGFAGIRILEVELTDQEHRLVVQPAFIIDSNTIPANQPTESYFVVQPPQLVR